MSINKKAGPITFAVGLICFGIILLITNLTGISAFITTMNFWPVLLIGLGLEYFVRSYMNKRSGEMEPTRFHMPTVVVVLIATLAGFAGQQVAGLFKEHEISNLVQEAVAGTNYNYERVYKSNDVDINPATSKLLLGDLQGKITLLPSTDNKLRIQATIIGWGSSREIAKLRADMVNIKLISGRVISLTRLRDQSETIKRQADVTYQVMVPKGLKVEIEGPNEKIKADSLENDLQVDLDGGEVSISNLKGNINCDGQFGELNFRNIIGNVNTKLEDGTLKADNISGSIWTNIGRGKIDIASTYPVNSNYSVNSESGQIMLSIPLNSNVKIQAKTESGPIMGSMLSESADGSSQGIKTNKDIRENDSQGTPGPGEEYKLTLGNGKGIISLINQNGSIKINNRQ